MAKELSQADRRKPAKLTDQFGRKWETTVDVVSNGACAPINPLDFTDRLHTPQKYLKADMTERTLYVDVDAWINDLEVAHKEYDTLLYNDAMMLFGQAGVKMYEDKAPALIKHTGEGPQPLAPVKAAKAGNKFCLGLSDQMPEWSKQYFVSAKKEVEQFPDAEEYADYEEDADPEATGGKRVPVKNKTRLQEAA